MNREQFLATIAKTGAAAAALGAVPCSLDGTNRVAFTAESSCRSQHFVAKRVVTRAGYFRPGADPTPRSVSQASI
jgi:hypothetical protein